MAAVVASVVLLAALGFALLTWGPERWPWEGEAPHDNVTAWLTCNDFLQDSVPDARSSTSPWMAAQEQVRRVDERTYWASGSAALGDDAAREVRFECVIEWSRGGWHLRSLDFVLMPLAGGQATSRPTSPHGRG